ncbi:hypothetical protein KP509_35G020100 [Ceratopteris richardii]|uniref:Fatty acid desaturase domain-containing protein n=1 Tax=Ceratopteris richardii TaxID=49495 RepID=A0A8T2QFM6_CERRI|nr:hypothetical protein KP509_35G020100 [Ceratopteris richardii]
MARVAEFGLEKAFSVECFPHRLNEVNSGSRPGQYALLKMPLYNSKRRSTGTALPKFSSLVNRKSNVSVVSGMWRTISAVAAPIAPTLNDPSYREKLAEEYGFTQIGDPVPPNVTLKNVIDSFPPEVFEIDNVKAWRTVVISIVSYVAGLFMISKAPWYLLPLAWAWTGTAITGFFVIGHGCAHKSFSNNKLIEDIVGTLAFLPLIYPYEPWRVKHDRHHAKTNMLVEDTA